MKQLKILFFTASLLTIHTLSAQDDLGSSLSADITKRIIPGLNLSLEEDFRLRDNLSEVDRFSTTLELSYKPWKFLKLGGAYNLINYNHETKGWEVRHRYYFFATGSYRINRFTVSLRERFQSTYRVGVKETSKRANPKLYLRSRLEVEYDIRNCKFEPFASVELYNTLNDPQGNKMNKLKYTAGSKYKLNKRNSLQLYYRYVNFKDDDEGNGKHMIGLGYSYKF
ncbi:MULTISPECIES: DUF2490 domain-containing protein [Parabacteroides]|jgi:hypothetical protein|uniref:DUF2490 domain-containing protein n=1 Tax=Parabacteroides TaxID=375288 RepID=UPI000EFE3D1E|nr:MULTISPECIES: DUF2490 domain-containing protein [Parabacteroides]MBC8618557.1 DUF2490 domain-containing protein [Parabacteroides faecis]RHR40127.1 DUF2490 domain-containing protein [Parabacteroides sp. AF18-52]RHR94738.1 DUF2490 domain-containing protein [Parabacteroides sp. AF14-59]